jgi:hypothetical protein
MAPSLPCHTPSTHSHNPTRIKKCGYNQTDYTPPLASHCALPALTVAGSVPAANNLACCRKNTVNGERLEYFLAVSAGIGGEPLRQQRAPGVNPVIRLQGLSQTLVLTPPKIHNKFRLCLPNNKTRA